MIDVHCPESPTGRHQLYITVDNGGGFDFSVRASCKICMEFHLEDDEIEPYLNAAMMLTADEAEAFVRDGTLDPTHVFERYARKWRGE